MPRPLAYMRKTNMKMILNIVTDYRDYFPELSGKELTDALIRKLSGHDEIEIARTKEGKPYCKNMPETAKLHFSVSHSENIFACIFSEENVGLDVQHRRNINRNRIAARYFTDEEKELVSRDANEFFRIWTRKEAYAKFTGEGLKSVMSRDSVLKRTDVKFRDIRINNGSKTGTCFCAVCVGAEKGDMLNEIQISYRKQNG